MALNRQDPTLTADSISGIVTSASSAVAASPIAGNASMAGLAPSYSPGQVSSTSTVQGVVGPVTIFRTSGGTVSTPEGINLPITIQTTSINNEPRYRETGQDVASAQYATRLAGGANTDQTRLPTYINNDFFGPGQGIVRSNTGNYLSTAAVFGPSASKTPGDYQQSFTADQFKQIMADPVLQQAFSANGSDSYMLQTRGLVQGKAEILQQLTFDNAQATEFAKVDYFRGRLQENPVLTQDAGKMPVTNSGIGGAIPTRTTQTADYTLANNFGGPVGIKTTTSGGGTVKYQTTLDPKTLSANGLAGSNQSTSVSQTDKYLSAGYAKMSPLASPSWSNSSGNWSMLSPKGNWYFN